MLRIVKILSIASMGLAALTIVTVLVQIVRGGEGSLYLSEPGAIERFEQKSGTTKTTTDSESLLVKQARLIGLAFNPPPPPQKEVVKAGPTTPIEITKPTEERPEIKVALNPKFKLIATACYASVPDQSLALLDLTSQGPKWYRLGETVEGLTIREIKENAVTLYQGETLNGTVEMAQSPTIFPSLLKSDAVEGRPVSYVRPADAGFGDLSPNPAGRDNPRVLDKNSLETAPSSGAAALPPAPRGPRTIMSSDPAAALMDAAAAGAITAGSGTAAKPATGPAGAATDTRTALRRGTYRPPVPPTRTIPNAPVRTPAPPPTPESQKAEMDKNIEDIRKLMGTPNPGTGGADPSEDQKAWGELLKLMEEERKNLDTAASGGTAAPAPAAPPSTPAPAAPPSTPGPAPTPPAPQPETRAPSEPAPSDPPAEPAPSTPPAEPAQPTPPAGDSPPANTDNSGN